VIELPGFDFGHKLVLSVLLAACRSRVDRGGLDFQRLENSAEIQQIFREIGTSRVQGNRSFVDRGILQTLGDDDRFGEPETVRLHVVGHVTARVGSDRDPGRRR